MVFDELFKGTNTVERIAINSAVFSDLAKTDNLVLASTHDLELTALLHSQYDLYHFSETIADDKLQFDYKLKKGVAQEGNAIRILELCGYPSELVQSAKNILPSDTVILIPNERWLSLSISRITTVSRSGPNGL